MRGYYCLSDHEIIIDISLAAFVFSNQLNEQPNAFFGQLIVVHNIYIFYLRAVTHTTILYFVQEQIQGEGTGGQFPPPLSSVSFPFYIVDL